MTKNGYCGIIAVLYNIVTGGEIMSENERKTLELIHEAAKSEFLEKGYSSASLRNIVKNAGVTTGAFYGYYNSKAELFGALVDEVYSHIMRTYGEAHKNFADLPAEEKPRHLGKTTDECMNELLVYLLKHTDEVKLILQCSEGTKYAFMIDEMVEIEVEATHEYYKVLEALGKPAPKIDRRLEHILATGIMNAFFEIILHEMLLPDAKNYLRSLNDFYTAGWMKIMGRTEADG